MTYGLLFIALAVWGGIFYRFFAALNDSNDTNIPMRSQIKKIEPLETPQDTFVLLANYKDPFLGRAIPIALNYNNEGSQQVRPIFKNIKKKVQPTPAPIPVIQVQWPSLKYIGVIQNKNTEKLVGILQVNGQEQMVKTNDMAMGVKILSIHKDTIALTYQNDKKTLYKGQSFP